MDVVAPQITALPVLSTAMALPPSAPLPPTNVEYTRVFPSAAILVTKASPKAMAMPSGLGPKLVSRAPVVVGKPLEPVMPVI